MGRPTDWDLFLGAAAASSNVVHQDLWARSCKPTPFSLFDPQWSTPANSLSDLCEVRPNVASWCAAGSAKKAWCPRWAFFTPVEKP